MVKAFYPRYTKDIWHTGKTGNRYKLDSLERMIGIRDLLKSDEHFEVRTVDEIDDFPLTLAHSPRLIEAYKTGKPKKLAESSGVLWQKNFYSWVINTSWAAIYSVKQALRDGGLLTIADGGHHAEYDSGFGFGPVNNMIIASKYLLKEGLVGKVGILDIDVHFANGTHSLAKQDQRILSTDIWKYKLDKWKFTSSSGNVLHIQVDEVEDYFNSLQLILERIKNFSPDILLLYLGIDILESDRMGGIKGFDTESLKKRNKLVGSFVKENSIPVSVFIGGGYINYQGSEREISTQKEQLFNLFKESIVDVIGL